MTEWPEHHQELGRKALDVLDTWSKRFDAKKITAREYLILLSGLYDTTSGLMPKEISALIADIHKDVLGQIKARASRDKAA